MGLIHAVVYGIIQGISEWLPISSSAHLQIAKTFLDPQIPTNTFTAFVAVIQLGTTAAVIVYFAKDLGAAFMAWARSLQGKGRGTTEARIGWGVFLGTLPVFILPFFKKQIESEAFRQIGLIATLMIAFGAVMFVADRWGSKKRSMNQVQPVDGLGIGFFQILAAIPGVSRSGSTITGALFLGLDMVTAARFSFLMSVPAVAGAGLYELWEARKDILGAELSATIVATLVSLIVGYATIAWLLRYLQKNGLAVFVGYRFLLGAILLAAIYTGHVPQQAQDVQTSLPAHSLVAQK